MNKPGRTGSFSFVISDHFDSGGAFFLSPPRPFVAPLIIFQPPQTPVAHLCELGLPFRLILWIKEFLCISRWHVKWNGCLSNEAL